MRRAVAAAVAAGLAVGLLAWLGRPSPRLRLPLPGVQPDSRVDIDQADAAGPAARWAFLRDTTHHTGWVFDHQTGRLHGPHPVPDAGRGYVGDAAGRLYAHAGLGTSVSGFPLTVWRVDPETGRFDPYYEFPDRLSIRRTVCDGEPAWLTFAAGPLRVEVIDLATGAARRRIDFPGRVGDLIDNGGPFAGQWTASADGHWLAFGEAWDGPRRVGPAGVEVWNLSTGRLAGRLTGYLPADAGDGFGASSLSFTSNGRLRFTGSTRVQAGNSYVPLLVGGRWRAWPPGGPCEPDPGDDRPDIPDLSLDYQPDDTDHGRRLYLGPASRDDRTATFVVAGDDRRPLHPRRTLSVPFDDYIHGDLRLRLAAGGTGVLVWSSRPDGPSADWLRRPMTWVGFPPFRFIDQLDWYDWRTGRSWRLRRYPERVIDVGCQPGGVVVCIHDRAAGRAELEVWDDPPDGWPAWGWWPLAAAAGGLVGGRFGRRRPQA